MPFITKKSFIEKSLPVTKVKLITKTKKHYHTLL